MTRTTMMIAGLALAAPILAQTTQPDPAVFQVASGVEFSINHEGSSDYVFAWEDPSGEFAASDPTFVLTAGETYIFRRVSGSHPFVICDDSLEVVGEDGMYFRVTTDESVIDAATLEPIDAFTADPAPTDDFIEWTPAADDAGTYVYTCNIAFHTGMTGIIRVEADAPCRADLDGDGSLTIFDFLAFQNLFDSGDPLADFDGDGSLTIFDFLAFQNTFDAGCP
ncbi:MAG: GC-type dockerin domain-anchored protein [Phycisphaerales bacterium JB060]